MSRFLAAALGALSLFTALRTEAAPKVVVSIVPIHSLVAGVMQGVAQPQLLIPVGASPHTYALKPSDARSLQSANVVVWVGEGFENYLEKPLKSLAGKATILEVTDIEGLTLLKVREGGAFDQHGDDDKAHGKKAPTKKDAVKNHGHDDHAHDGTDMHLWLDPDNARLIVSHIAAELGKVDPTNADAYGENARRLTDRIDSLDQGIKSRLASVQDRPYIVFHDAYQYFERHFGTKIAGSITVSPDQAPGAKRLSELRERIRTANAACIFREPQFPAPIVNTLVSGTGVKIGILDPEGADMTPGVDAYFTLMDRIADSLATCLQPAS